MKLKQIYFLPLFLLLNISRSPAQQVSPADSVTFYQNRYLVSKSDADLFRFEFSKSRFYRRLNNDSSLIYANRQLSLAKQRHNIFWEAEALSNKEYALRELGNLAEALNVQFRVLELSKQVKSGTIEGETLNSIGNTYLDMADARTALKYYRASLAALNKAIALHHPGASYWVLNEKSNIGNAFEVLNMPDSALFFEQKIFNDKQFPDDLRAELLGRLGNAYVKLGKYKVALNWYNKGLKNAELEKNVADLVSINYHVAEVYDKLNLPDSAIGYARKAFFTARAGSMGRIVLSSSKLLAEIYNSKAKIDSAYHYQQIEIRYNDSLFGARKFNRIQHILSDEQQRQQRLLLEQKDMAATYRMIGGIAILLCILIVAILILFNYNTQRKKNLLLDEQKTQITLQRDSLQATLTDLRKTQTQLIQSEKMASLGELTAGIAHEIQNPLNFVNNFSEVNTEMIDELESELISGNIEDALAIAADIKANEQKINHHGKRADAIVKGMLQHSQSGSGTKEPTNINSLADEYLRLSYHGLRSKDKTFNAEMVTHFDKKLPKINVIPQDIGRVLLNLFNNAFYAVSKKQKAIGDDYKAEVSVTTSSENGQVIISVKDNGVGIPDAIKDKIMQPFFTTKPTGGGTGLGLSLTYDMVVKGHGGSIQVNSVEGEGSEFIVTLPLN
jgi:two-component system NtrC family sensor kinase